MIEGFIWIGSANPDKPLGALIKKSENHENSVKNTLSLCAFASFRETPFSYVGVLSSYIKSWIFTCYESNFEEAAGLP